MDENQCRIHLWHYRQSIQRQFPVGLCNTQNNILYLHLLRQPAGNSIELKGMLSPIEKAEMLSSGEEVSFSCENICKLTLPDSLDYGRVPVLKLTCKEPVHINDANYMNESIISIPIASGTVVPGPEGRLGFPKAWLRRISAKERERC